MGRPSVRPGRERTDPPPGRPLKGLIGATKVGQAGPIAWLRGATLRGNQGRLRLPPQAARAGPLP
jgi:hypothetical protein